MKKKCLSLFLALALVLSLAACGGNGNTNTNGNQEPNNGAPEGPSDPAGSTEGDDAADLADLPGFPLTYDEDTLYEMNFGEFYALYTAAKEEKDLDTRRALIAIAEAKLLESGLIIPGTQTGSGNAMQDRESVV